MILNFDANDVSHQLAHDAHSGTSWTPEKRAEQEVQGYLNQMTNVAAEFEKWVTDENRVEMALDLWRFRAGYIRKLHALWGARSRIVSAFIAGPSGFPVKQMQKRNATADRRLTELLEYKSKVLDKLRRKYNPRLIARQPIRQGDVDAIEQLQAKIDKAQVKQDFMKAANKIIRSKKLDDDEKIAGIMALDDSVKEATARRFINDTGVSGKAGFQPYELTNNGANIRRMQKQITAIQAEQARREATPDEYKICGIQVIENGDLDRLQILFDGKPPDDVRAALKARGFHWSPSEEAWQRQLTNNARNASREVLARFYEEEK